MKNTQGSVLAVAVSMMLLVSTLGVGALNYSGMQGQNSVHQAISTKAFWAADAGMQKVYWDITKNGCATLGCASCDRCSSTQSFSGNLNNNGSSYSLSFNKGSTAITLTSTGTSNSRTRKLQANLNFSFLDYGLLGNSSVNLGNGTTIDSYNSNDGVYGGANSGLAGSVATNGSTGISGATAGAGGNLTGGSPTYSAQVILTPVTVPNALTSASNGGSLSAGTVSAGNYKYNTVNLNNGAIVNIAANASVSIYFLDNVTIKNNVTINIPSTSSLKIYLAGTFTAQNGAIINNNAQIPSKFIMYSTYNVIPSGNNYGIDFQNSTTFFGLIYAPYTSVHFKNNPAIYGSIVGSTITIDNGAAIHYDQALKSFIDPDFLQGGSFYNWTEIP